MERVVLITDTDTRLGSAILDAYGIAGERAVGVRTVSPFSPNGVSDESAPVIGSDGALTWNRCSAIDPRNIVLGTLRRFSTIDEVLIVQSLETGLPEKPELVDINKAIDYWIKGNMYFVREVLRVFAEKGKGVLALVNHFPSADGAANSSPLGEAIRSAFTGYIKALLPVYGENNIYINGFESSTTLTDDFAQFIHKNMNERFRKISGKFLVFHNQGARGLFGKSKRG